MLIVIFLVCSQSQTTTNTCYNDPSIYKIDIRQRIEDLGIDKTISDINLTQLCNETQTYDYIWLTQLWTPSKFNYKNTIIAEQTYNYREFESIKEYEFDPNLGSKLQFTNFIKGLKAICIHIKFLGEFSFYIGQDSSLLSNKARFLRRPQTISYNDQNERYDDKGLVWAVNSGGKTIPYTAVWNYFQYPIFMEMKDILENIIIQQHQLDGVVFLQPSLGLYEVANTFYAAEIDFYGDAKFMGDFYDNYKLKDSNTKIYFMGDLDNINAKPIILGQGLNQIYNPSPINVFHRYNYTFNSSTQFCNSGFEVTDIRVYNPSAKSRRCIMQKPFTLSKQCIKFNLTHIVAGIYTGTSAGITNYFSIKNSTNQDIFGMSANGTLGNDGYAGFKLDLYDMFEISYDAFTSELVFRKSNTQIFRYQWLDVSYQEYRFYVNLYHLYASIEMAFPYEFTDALKSTYLKVNGDRHIQSIKNSTKLQIGQVLQSINQYETNTSLNINALNIPTSSIMALGICNKDLVIINNHQIGQTIKSGGYLLFSNGSLIHSTNQFYNNQTTQGYLKGDLISISFLISNYSVVFEKNNIFIFSMFIGQFAKNLHFCVGFYQEFQSVSLEY